MNCLCPPIISTRVLATMFTPGPKDRSYFQLFQVHMTVDCPSMVSYRDGCALGPFVKMCKYLQPQISSVKIYGQFLSDKNPRIVKSRALALCSMKVGWHRLMGIDL